MEKLHVSKKAVNANVLNIFPLMVLMILNVFVNIHLKNTIEIPNFVKDKNAVVVKVL
jgi:hypothetical protein